MRMMAAPPNSKARVAICQSRGEKKKKREGKKNNNTISVKQAHRQKQQNMRNAEPVSRLR